TLLDEQRHERTNAVDDAPHVDADHPFPRRKRRLPRETTAAGTGVQAHDVDGTEPGDDRLGERLHLAGVGHVDDRSLDFATIGFEFGNGAFERVDFDVADHHLHPGAEKLARHAQTDAARAAGHRCDFAVQLLHEPQPTNSPHSGVTHVPREYLSDARI